MRETMFAKWRQALLDIGFMTPDTADHMMLGIRRILSRGTLTEKDVQILLGMASQTQWAANQLPRKNDNTRATCFIRDGGVAQRSPHLANLKAALDRLQRPPGWRLETILVDGGSTDNSVDVARQAGFDECAVLPGASIPVCRNQALRMARGNALAFLDGDCVPARDWLMHAAPWLLKPTPSCSATPCARPKPATGFNAPGTHIGT